MSRIRIAKKLPYLKFPLYYEGAPQRRLFFPDWYLTLVKPRPEMPSNYVRFHVPADMTKYDMKEYLEKVYDVPVMSVRLSIVNYMRYKSPLITKASREGRPRYEWKFLEPWKIAHVFLGEGKTFEYPDVFKVIDDEILGEEELGKSNDMEEIENKTLVEQFDQHQKDLKKLETKVSTKDSKIYFENKWF